jgi:hypothetical protein
MARVEKGREYKVLVNYNMRTNGVHVARSLYTGPHEKHANKAWVEAKVLGEHGVLVGCTLTFFDGYRLRHELSRVFDWPVV